MIDSHERKIATLKRELKTVNSSFANFSLLHLIDYIYNAEKTIFNRA